MKKYFLILIMIFSLFLISAVAADENASQTTITTDSPEIPIEYKDFESSRVHIVEMFTGDITKPSSDVRKPYQCEDNLTEKCLIKHKVISQDQNKKNASLTISLVNRTLDGNGTILIEGNQNATGLIYLSILKEPIKLTNGKASYTFNGISKGAYSIEMFYTGDETFGNCTYNYISINIPSFSTKIVQNDVIIKYYKNGTQYEATLYDDLNRPYKNQEIIICLNGEYRKITDKNGKFSLNLNIEPGNYRMEIIYMGMYTLISGCKVYCNLTVLPTISGNNITKIYKNNTQYETMVLDSEGKILPNRNVTFNINGVFYNRTSDEKGVAKLNINLAPGKYIITAENVDGLKISNNITILPTIISNDLVKIYKNGTQFSVKLIGKNGTILTNTSVKLNINGRIYNKVTDENGIATLNINLNPGKYIITTENSYDNCKVSNNIEVENYIYSSDLVKYYKNESRYVVRLVDEKYNPVANEKVYITVNGVTYTKTTDKNGMASLAINLLPGVYKITSKSKTKGLVCSDKITVLSKVILPEKIKTENKLQYPVKIVKDNGNPAANQTVTFELNNTKKSYTTNDEGIVSAFNVFDFLKYIDGTVPTKLTVTYNDYTLTTNVQYILFSLLK